MYSMKEACRITNLPYETLKFYCNEGLVPNVKRNSHNYRIFDDRDIAWINGLICLKKCGMGITEMKHYTALCLQGKSSIPERKQMLDQKKEFLLEKLKEINECIDYIADKQTYYDHVLSGTEQYKSNLIQISEK